MSSLYEQALADVKKLKEVAEAEASQKLLKSIQTHVKRLVEEELMQLDDFGGATTSIDPLEVDTAAEDDIDGTVPQIPTNPPPRMPGSSTMPVNAVAVSGTQPIAITADLTACVDEPTSTAMPAALDNAAVSETEPNDPVVPSVEQQEPPAEVDTSGDLDMASAADDDDEAFELDFDTDRMIETIKKAKNKKLMSEKQVAKKISLIESSINMVDNRKLLRNKTHQRIQSLIESIESTYNYVQEFLPGSAHRVVFEEKLEKQYQQLNSLLEQRENKMKRQPVNEEDLTVKLTGLPEMDDEQLEELGVDLVAGEDEEVADEESFDDSDADMGSDDADFGSDDDTEFDFGSDEDELDVDENTMIEIDEAALFAEIKKMKSIREEKAALAKKAKSGNWSEKPTHAKKDADEKGAKPGANEADDFGGGKFAAKPKFVKEADESCSEDELASKVQSRKNDKGKKVAEGKATTNGALSQAMAYRKQLAEVSLLNTKLVYTNKLLQSEMLTKKQKAAIVERLDEAATIAEAKLIYESLTKALNRVQGDQSHQRVMGSSSAVVSKSGSSETTQLDEGFSTGRWAKLAGILKG